MTTIVLTPLCLHASIENLTTTGCTVVRRKDEDCVIVYAKILEEFTSRTKVVVNIGDHTEKGSDSIILTLDVSSTSATCSHEDAGADGGEECRLRTLSDKFVSHRRNIIQNPLAFATSPL